MSLQYKFILSLFLSFVLLFGCSKPKTPIKIGLSINLSGRGGLAGEYIRDGALLAIRDINRSGGIKGRELQLLIEDDHNNKAGVHQADSILISNGVVVIIGHSTSQNTIFAYPYIQKKKMLLFTPYAATTKLSQKDDYFIRTQVDNRQYGIAFSKYFSSHNIKRIAFLMDFSNRAYVEDLANQIIRYSDSKIVAQIPFNPKKKISWPKIIKTLVFSEAQAIVLLTEVSMTSLAAQKLRSRGFNGILMGSIWCQTPDLIRFGGKALEQFVIISFIDPNIDNPLMQSFRQKFSQAFQRPVSARSMRAYEIITILSRALESLPEVTTEELKKTLLRGKYHTLLGTVRFDSDGDVQRPVYEITVENGRFKTKGSIH